MTPIHQVSVPENAPLAALRIAAARKARERRLMLTLYPVPWIIGGFFMSRALGQPPSLAIIIAVQFTLAMGGVLACLFFFGGIEGYEASVWLKPFSLDLCMAGTGPAEFGGAVMAHACGRYDRRLIRLAAAGLITALAAGSTVISANLHELFTWNASIALVPAGFLFVGIKRHELFAARNSLMWIGRVRRDYERQFIEARQEAGARRGRSGAWLAAVAVALAFAGVAVGLYLADLAAFWLFTSQYFLSGMGRKLESRLVFGVGAAAYHALAGGVWAWILVSLIRPQAAQNVEEIGRELHTLTRYRAQLTK